MINAAIVGLGRWGKAIVESVQGKNERLRFVRGVSKEPREVAGFAATHGFEVGAEFADAVADPRVQAVVLATRTRCTSIRSLRWRGPASRSGARSRSLSVAARPSVLLPPAATPASSSASATTSGAFLRCASSGVSLLTASSATSCISRGISAMSTARVSPVAGATTRGAGDWRLRLRRGWHARAVQRGTR